MKPSKIGISKVLAVAVAAIIAIGIVSSVVFFGAPPKPAEIVKEPTKETPKEEQKEIVNEPPKELPKESPDPRAGDLRKAVEQHFAKFEAKDVIGLLQDYVQQGASGEWSGQAGAFKGTFSGYGSIRIHYAAVMGNTEDMKIHIEDYKANILNDGATVTMTVNGEGHGKLIGNFNMTVAVAQKWVYQDGRWLLQEDRWDFKVLKTELVAEGTVFPIHWRKLGDFSIWNDRWKIFP